jgi:hypothetical protein
MACELLQRSLCTIFCISRGFLDYIFSIFGIEPASATMSARIVAATAFAAIAVLGVFSILGLPARNGMGDLFAAETEQTESLLASIGQTSKTHFTKLDGLDAFLDQLIAFSIRCVNGENKALSLFTTYFTGQVTATHAILVLEGLRTGNKNKIIS